MSDAQPRWWIMGFRWYGFKFIKAESPCMKGELNLGWITIGWQR